ncbi:MAG: hypothetical protein ABWZ08_07270 [Pseudoxanthomonas sp.]
MKRMLALFLVALLASCATERPIPTPPAPGGERSTQAVPAAPTSRSVTAAAQATPNAVGDQALADVLSWYNNTAQNCGSATAPAFVCSGVLLRATETNPAFLPWDPSPPSIKSGGVSFSWLRSDTNFSELVYNYWNGYLMYPPGLAPGGAYAVQVLCVFPMDANTANRPTLQGCGPGTATPATSAPCDTQGITTALLWGAHFISLADKYTGQCGWDMRRGVAATADRFNQSIQSRKDLASQWWAIQNELRVGTWPTGTGKALPIRAFFYVPGKTGALANAQDDQKRYRDNYGIDMPILRMSLPTAKGGRTTFAYAEADQGGGGPEPGVGFNFENVPLVSNVTTIDNSTFLAYGDSLSIRDGSSPGQAIKSRHLEENGDVPTLYLSFRSPGRVQNPSFAYRIQGTYDVMLLCYLDDGTSPTQILHPGEGRASCNVPGRGVVEMRFGSFGSNAGLWIDDIMPQ